MMRIYEQIVGEIERETEKREKERKKGCQVKVYALDINVRVTRSTNAS